MTNPYAEACKKIEAILNDMPDDDLVYLMESIGSIGNKFDGLFLPITIGELMEGGYDREDLVDACLAIGATDYDDRVRYDINGGWTSAAIEDMAADAHLYADDAAEYIMANEWDIELLDWPNNSILARICDIVKNYWDSVENPAA